MTQACYKPELHLYDAERSVFENVWTQPWYNCENSFLLATDLGTVCLLVGSLVSGAVWRSRRFLAKQVLGGGLVVWAGFMIFHAGRYLGRAEELRAGYYDEYLAILPQLRAAVLQQTLFELIVFFLIPFVFARALRRAVRPIPAGGVLQS